MKAIVFEHYGTPDVLKLKEVQKPTAKDDEVLIKVHAASINDWDWCMVRGKPFYVRLLCGLLNPKIMIPGVDVAGRVEAIGKNVKTIKPGDDVYGDLSECGFGAFAEYVCADETALARKPPSMTFVEAAAIPHAAMLAVQGLRDEGKIQPGQKLLFNGAGGGVGTLGVQIAKYEGVDDITGVDSADKSEMMISTGFDKTIDYRMEDFTKNGHRYDLILDAKTSRSVFEYLRALTPEGTYVTVGGRTARLLQTFLLGPIIRMVTKKKFRVVDLKPNKDLEYINNLYQAGKIKPVIDGLYTLNEVPLAIQRFGEGRHKGKMIVTIDPNEKP